MTQSNLKFTSQYEVERPMENTISQFNQHGSAALPLSKRISSILKEFAVGMQLAQRHNNNQSFDINILAAHNLRLLHQRLERTTEYAELLHKKNQQSEIHGDQLWQCLFEENELTCGFIKMQGSQELPCFNHPGMSSMYLVLSGQARLKQYTLAQTNTESHEKTDNQVKLKELSSEKLSEGAAVYYQTDTNTLASLSTAENECLLLNIQLSRHNEIH